ncbi:hypothetical protein [Photobacterium profundum]|uniref:Uncharacterized protein n=1 Tax=Photobacterium profundum 3TCK TaxID=314280 RepID=Q1Z5E0_9GAMM|nr:hypothetical protein [Photobacterium profundum]EAS43626.1 hypothetical protein P3TCK_17642 [Photobacterium profundum 3TCK]
MKMHVDVSRIDAYVDCLKEDVVDAVFSGTKEAAQTIKASLDAEGKKRFGRSDFIISGRSSFSVNEVGFAVYNVMPQWNKTVSENAVQGTSNANFLNFIEYGQVRHHPVYLDRKTGEWKTNTKVTVAEYKRKSVPFFFPAVHKGQTQARLNFEERFFKVLNARRAT